MKLLPTLYRVSLCLPPRVMVALVMVGWLLWSPLLHAVELRLPDGGHKQACHTLEVFVRQGCPHCSEAKSYLVALQRRHPTLIITFHDVVQDAAARQRFLSLSARHGVSRPGVPSFFQCNEFYVGFSSEGDTIATIEARISGSPATTGVSEISTPLGNLSVQALGLPVFTIALGLVDGFNPCAMWVLLFLLSILVNVRDRRRILIIAGTFVLVSGLVYFAFMAAWLNLFLLIGIARWLQIALGLVAVTMGMVHLKDFIVPGQGLSLSIPGAAKSSLYARVRDVMYARNLWAALAAIIVLAMMVNVVELLCTAGLPALYTQILSQSDLSTIQHYGYLALYNLAYIFDDSVMVAIAVVTLGKHKLQQGEGRWLKLVSGVVVILLGLLLLLAPDRLL
jgi:glutaredoxin